MSGMFKNKVKLLTAERLRTKQFQNVAVMLASLCLLIDCVVVISTGSKTLKSAAIRLNSSDVISGRFGSSHESQ